ncbi:MAG: hydrogenase iron-sulfur subunit [Desulfobacterales bacterium]|nr:hydrogenase iron-sulfur subunit [Desulfobacterales bacterium]
MTIISSDLQHKFKFEVTAMPGGELVKRCLDCGTCTGVCPVSKAEPAFDPRRILHMIRMGLKDRLLGSEAIWYCSHCDTCAFVCPQDVQFSTVVDCLREMAVREGYVDTGILEAIGKLPALNTGKCMGCLTCLRICPFNAPSIKKKGLGFIEFDPLKCRACGICVAECPGEAIVLEKPAIAQTLAFEEAVDTVFVPKMIALCCHYVIGDRVSDPEGLYVSGFPKNMRLEIVACTGELKVTRLLGLFEDEADGVCVIGCEQDACHNLTGSRRAKKRVQYVKKLLSQLKIEPERIEIFMVPRDQTDRFIEVSREMKKRVKMLGPSPLRR